MRLVFILYAEDRDLLSNNEVYQKYYAVTGLFERLREDASRRTDTMDHRYGAWAQLPHALSPDTRWWPTRRGEAAQPKGHLFDPDRYPVPGGSPEGLEAAARRAD